MSKAGFQAIPCFIYALQLVMNDAIFEQRYEKKIIEVCKQIIISHFNHSPSAFVKYNAFREKLNVPRINSHKISKLDGIASSACFLES